VASSPIPKIEPPIGAVELEDTAPIVSSEPAPVEQAEPVYPSWRVLARWLLVALALYAVGWLLWNAGPALLPFLIGLVLAYLLTPIVNLLDRRMPRSLAILIVYVGGIALLVVSINYIVPPVLNQTQQLIESIPSLERLQQIGNDLLREYRANVPASIQTPIEEGIRNALRTAQANMATYVEDIGTFIFNQILQVLNTLTFLIGFLIIPIWLFYVLNDQAKGYALIDRLIHSRIRADFWNIWGMINRVFSDYIRGQLILGLTVGVMVGLGLLFLRLLGFEVRYILLLAIIAGVTELIPIIGPTLGAIPGVLLGFIVPETGALQTGLLVLAVYITVQQIENSFLVPRIIGESVGIHPAILTVVLIAMGHIFGLLGVILAAPLSAIARDLFIYIYRRLEGFSAAAAQAIVNKQAEVDAKAAQS
jgi:predicted PurR-regulated permease PerM